MPVTVITMRCACGVEWRHNCHADWTQKQHVGHSSPCEDRPDGSCAQPEPASACAHCGDPDHTWDDCQAYMDAVATDAAPAALRDQIAAAIRACATFDFDTHVIGDPQRITDAVLQVRDTEMERLRGELGALKQAHVALAEQAGKDQAALDRVRAVAQNHLHDSDDGTDPCAAAILAALDQQEQAVECPPGVHSLFDPCPGDCSKPLNNPEEQR
ncbi:hypothetical protein ACPB9J_15985 [Streptomyces lavendulocolor]|uniref:hypothetical protein n=1 Tax=Streptomyces lavendulocolor TaxID=67316 RepID=UPI003C2C3407